MACERSRREAGAEPVKTKPEVYGRSMSGQPALAISIVSS
jgi:hypothetical protein